MYEICLVRIKEQVGEEGITVCTHRYADCLLKNTSTKDNKYIVNKKIEHVDISFRELFLVDSELFLQNKICPFLRQDICHYICWAFFFMKHSWINSFNLSLSFEW